jgi:hypothetical protein
MKNSITYIILLLIFSGSVAFGQLEGKRFISGSANVGFNNQNPDAGNATNGYSYDVYIGLGKFKTATKTGEWRIFSSLGGGKQQYFFTNEPVTSKGIKSFSMGTGYFWNFYKHFSDKFGIFGGPGLTLDYGFSKQLTNVGSVYYDTKSNRVSFAFQIGAGAYYVLNERWWLTGSLGFSNPVSLAYSFGESTPYTPGTDLDNSGFEYRLSPSFNFPSVGLGLRYFFKD